VALSTAKVEYLAASATAAWLRELLFRLFGLGLEATCIWCESHSCVKVVRVFSNKVDAGRDQIPLCLGHGREGSNKAPIYCYRQTGSRYVDQASVRDKLGVVQIDFPSSCNSMTVII
jgi:hypothetical protein